MSQRNLVKLKQNCFVQKKSRIQLLQEAKEGNCSCEGREGAWLEVAIQTLRNNGISIEAFCTAVYIALKKGRGKYQNIFIHGPANSGKTFILKPLKVIYHTFCNPATGTFAWLGVEQAEIIFLNDFRWTKSIIAWADLLQALEGDTVHLPTPKNFCKRDIELSKDVHSIFRNSGCSSRSYKRWLSRSREYRNDARQVEILSLLESYSTIKTSLSRALWSMLRKTCT